MMGLPLKYLSLIFLCVQNCLVVLVTRYTRTRDGDMYFPTAIVLVIEAVKLLLCFVVIMYQEKSKLAKKKAEFDAHLEREAEVIRREQLEWCRLGYWAGYAEGVGGADRMLPMEKRWR